MEDQQVDIIVDDTFSMVVEKTNDVNKCLDCHCCFYPDAS